MKKITTKHRITSIYVEVSLDESQAGLFLETADGDTYILEQFDSTTSTHYPISIRKLNDKG